MIPPQFLILSDSISLSKDTCHVTGGADIYQGQHRGRLVACKRLRRVAQNGRRDVCEEAAQAIQEGLMSLRCQGPGILPFRGIHLCEEGPESPALYLVSRYQASGTVVDYLLSDESANRLLLIKDIVQGLGFLHDVGVVHGDINNDNILVDGSGHALIGSFGHARLLSDGPVDISKCDPRRLVGAVAYQPAEYLEAVLQDTFLIPSTGADIYSLGCLAYKLFVGRSPFYDIAPKFISCIRDCHIMTAVAGGGQPTKPKASDPAFTSNGLTHEVWALIEECWDRNCQNRPSADAIAKRAVLTAIPDGRDMLSPE
ncbi:kinase-like domain-containing protein [Ephemerocybe angulata]|uniref:Kinase-like domain-containing protein n=1 Tax=Ephemerocybe angulata TaxID=980116 RepID=A0A8H6HKP6_9AGAR|nr:kinase-like domain-containing protein [Tulosesus angulatus]